MTDHILHYGTPTLLRTSLNVEDHSDGVLLLAWKARVTRRAQTIIDKQDISYNRLDISWLLDLVRLSSLEDGPTQARKFLLKIGIIFIAEAQIPGMKLDGAAFLVEDVPVVGLTLRRDTLDNFWFTLLHELAHVILHYRTGLRAGFFDDTEATNIDEIEQEANEFASNMLIPDEKWKRSPARIAKSASFARELNINPAIAFGRLQKERGDYAIVSNKIGRGLVRRYLLATD